jgi:malonate transporter and related proteins
VPGRADLLLREHPAFRRRADDDGAVGRGAGIALEGGLKVVRQIAFHPFIIATAAGVLARGCSSSRRCRRPLLQYLAQAAAPCALFAMGVTLALRPLKRVPRELGLIAALKLVVHP